jgi:type IV fimbrial biogenesis protein FimT
MAGTGNITMLVLQATSQGSRLDYAGRRPERGFTLLELMIAVAVVGIVAAIGYPGMTAIISNGRLGGAANEMVATLQLARLEAVRLNRTVTVCRSVDGASCSAGAVWNGWITIADVDRDGAVDDILRASSVPAAVQLRASTAIQGSRIAFGSDGLAHVAGGSLLNAWVAVCIPGDGPEGGQRRISIAGGSRISTRSENRGGQCGAPGNNL